MSAMTPTAAVLDFKVADLSLAEFGRKEITLAEHEMPGLMAIRREYADAQPLLGARITGSRFGKSPRMGKSVLGRKTVGR